MEVAVRDACLIAAGFESGVEALRLLGVNTVEVLINQDGLVRSLVGGQPRDLNDEHERERFREELETHGLRVGALLCSQDFNAPDRDAHVRWVVNAVRAADSLGIPALRIDSAMSGQDDLPLDERIRIFGDAVTTVLRETAGSETALGIENHGRQGNDLAWMRGVLRYVGSPRVGLTLDVGNWYWYGHPLSRVYEICREFAPVVKATHVKNIAYPEELRETQREVGYEYGKYCCPLAEGDLDLARIAALLKQAGYDGPLTIEDESLGKFPVEERAAVLKRDVEHLTASIAG